MYKSAVDWKMTVSVPDGPDALIKQKDVHHYEETLGNGSCSTGTEDTYYTKTLNELENWASRTSTGHLPTCYTWVSNMLKLWAGISGNNCHSSQGGKHLLSVYHFQMLSFLEVNQNIKKEWCTILQVFGDIGIVDLSIEQTICRLNMLVQHFWVPSVLEKIFKASLEATQLEAGLNINPLTCSYETYENLLIYCWLKILWERL